MERAAFRVGRRDVIKGAFAAATAAVGSGLVGLERAFAHALPPGEWDRRGYAQAIRTDSDARATFSSPHLKNADLYLLQAKNWFQAMEVSYENDPDEIRLVMANYGPMNFITYGSYVWDKYEVGKWQSVNDPRPPGGPASRNIYLDDIAKLQDRHAVFLT